MEKDNLKMFLYGATKQNACRFRVCLPKFRFSELISVFSPIRGTE